MAGKRRKPLFVRDLPGGERVLHRFFVWESRYGKNRILFLLGDVLERPKNTRLRFRNSDDNIPLVKVYRIFPEGDEDSEVGYMFWAGGDFKATAGYVHIGEPSGGAYEPRIGMAGVQAYTGDSDTVLISTAAGDSYLDKVKADIIV